MAYSVATFHIVLDVGDLVFKLNPDPTENAHITSIVSSRIESRAHPCRKPPRDTFISVERRVPQGSCLGPLLFTIYVSKLFQILKHHLPSVHTYADDTHLYLSFKQSDTFSEVEAVSAMQKCICDVRAWMREDQLMLNDDKTEFLIIGTRQQLSKVSIQSINVGQAEVSSLVSARNTGTWFDTHLDMGTHITKTCSSAFYYLYNMRHIRKYLSRESTEKLVHAFISSRLDYCNSLLYGIRSIKLGNCNVL